MTSNEGDSLANLSLRNRGSAGERGPLKDLEKIFVGFTLENGKILRMPCNVVGQYSFENEVVELKRKSKRKAMRVPVTFGALKKYCIDSPNLRETKNSNSGRPYRAARYFVNKFHTKGPRNRILECKSASMNSLKKAPKIAGCPTRRMG